MSDDQVKRMNDARDFPANTCGASRHAAMIAEALCNGADYPMLAEEPDHCGESIAATVAALWECRNKLAKAVRFTSDVAYRATTIEHDQDEMELLDLGALRHQRDCDITQARTTLAELKGQDDE